jgi:23S rRNA (adenine2030-N6)-methyltransferase
MNYRHIYHAGNFADVLKHAVLALIIEYLKLKPAPLRVIDTHAGVGLYDLSCEAAGKTGEWRDGIGRLMGPDAEPVPDPITELLKPYLDVVWALNGSPGAIAYPGSPEIARRLLRPDDKLLLNELHATDHAALARRYGIYTQVRVLNLDAWIAVKSLLPPPERRGLILIDPPYEEKDELERLARALGQALKRFANGTFLLWYPVKDLAPVEAFHASLAGFGLVKTLRMELYTRAPETPHRLNGCGLLAVNPPWHLEQQMAALLPFLAQRLANGPGGGWRLSL